MTLIEKASIVTEVEDSAICPEDFEPKTSESLKSAISDAADIIASALKTSKAQTTTEKPVQITLQTDPRLVPDAQEKPDVDILDEKPPVILEDNTPVLTTVNGESTGESEIPTEILQRLRELPENVREEIENSDESSLGDSQEINISEPEKPVTTETEIIGSSNNLDMENTDSHDVDIESDPNLNHDQELDLLTEATTMESGSDFEPFSYLQGSKILHD